MAPEGETPDARPTNARDQDIAVWLKALVRKSNAATRAEFGPPQLAVGVSGGCQIKIIDTKLKIEEAKRNGAGLVLVCLDLVNAHSE